MEYKVINTSLEGFWEDKDKKTFGINSDLVINVEKDLITIDSNGKSLFLLRDGKKAKVSEANKKIKGNIKDGDKLLLENELWVEFYKKNILPVSTINWNLWMGIFVLLILFVIIFAGWQKKTESVLENDYQKISAEIKDKITKSDEIKSIDPETSLSILNEAKNMIQKINSNKKHENETNEIEKQINEKMATTGSAEVAGHVEIYDTKIADTDNRRYDKFVIYGDEAILTDSNSRKIIQVNLISKNVNKFEIKPDIANMFDVTYFNKKIFVYDGKYLWDLNGNKEIILGDIIYSKLINWNKSWYLLGQEGKISKVIDNKITEWTTEESTKIDIPVAMTIDGTIWVVGRGGQVINYEKGKSKKWEPSLQITNEKIVGIATTGDSQKIAISSEKMVRLYEKSTGKLVTSHNFEKVGIVSAQMTNNDQIYVLGTDQKIYKVK
ncbi:MAG: hypothetical protein WC069_04220 [Candidatus Shapirobacteria bacterium]